MLILPLQSVHLEIANGKSKHFDVAVVVVFVKRLEHSEVIPRACDNGDASQQKKCTSQISHICVQSPVPSKVKKFDGAHRAGQGC